MDDILSLLGLLYLLSLTSSSTFSLVTSLFNDNFKSSANKLSTSFSKLSYSYNLISDIFTLPEPEPGYTDIFGCICLVVIGSDNFNVTTLPLVLNEASLYSQFPCEFTNPILPVYGH